MKHLFGYGILLILIGILFYLHFADKKKIVPPQPHTSVVENGNSASSRIAYINIDTLQNHYDYYRKVEADMEKREKNAQNEIMSLQKKFQNRAAELQQKAAQMSPKEQESAMMEINKMQQDFQAKQQSLHEGLADYNQKMKSELLGKIEEYLKEYNNDGKFAYVFSYEPGFMFFKDSTLDITQDVIKGLNEAYNKK